MRKDIIKLTGYKFKCIKLDLDCDFDEHNSRFTEGFIYREALSSKNVAKKYVWLVDDFGKVLYIERKQFSKI